jgi:hypothetical protein
MIRRGLPYGEPLPASPVAEAPGSAAAEPADYAVADGQRGLVFACFVASIERQFEEVQRGWCNDGDAFGLGVDRDFVAGRPAVEGELPNKLTVAGRSPLILEQPRDPFVVMRGGDYLFAPAISALRALAGARW